MIRGLTPVVRGRDSRRGRREHFRRRGRRRYGQPITPIPTALIRLRSLLWCAGETRGESAANTSGDGGVAATASRSLRFRLC